LKTKRLEHKLLKPVYFFIFRIIHLKEVLRRLNYKKVVHLRNVIHQIFWRLSKQQNQVVFSTHKKIVILGAWDRNGSSFKEANRGLIEMIAAGILPFSLVEQPGFVRFCKIIQPRYNPPGRRHFTQVELQSAYDDMKV